jgi:hypothetical protein
MTLSLYLFFMVYFGGVRPIGSVHGFVKPEEPPRLFQGFRVGQMDAKTLEVQLFKFLNGLWGRHFLLW